jgi:cytochrome c
MKKAIILITLLLFSATPGLAAKIDRGKLLFNDPDLGKGSNGKTCNTCHEGGLDLAINVFHKENFEVMGVGVKNIREAVNFCIQVTLRGEGLALQGQDMTDILSYLDFIAKKGGGKKFDP